jgi:transcriptional regulator with XRE-family HTH domain
MDFQDDFIANLKYYRKERNISQEMLAELCDCATSTIGCIECGRQTPSFELLVKIASALKISPADLFLRNASTTVNNTKSLLKSKLIPQIEDFIEKEL